MSEAEYPPQFSEEAQKLVARSEQLLSPDRPEFEAREEFREEAEGLVKAIDSIFVQTRGQLWQPYVDVRINVAMLYLAQERNQKAEELGLKTINKLASITRKRRERMTSYLRTDPFRGAKLHGVVLHARRRQEKMTGSQGRLYSDFYNKLENADKERIHEFFGRSG